jgi:FtsZ-interacting cell division protein ZipA
VQLGPNPNAADNSLQTPIDGVEDTSGTNAIEAQPGSTGGLLERFSAENSMIPNILMVVGMIAVVFIMFRSLRRTHKANAVRTNDLGSPAERIEEIHQHAAQSMQPAERLMVDAEEIARRLGAALDNKAARLELLIEEADAKLDQLNRAITSQERPGSPSNVPPAPESRHAPTPAPRSIDPSLMDRARMEQDLEERGSRVAGRIEPEAAASENPVAEISISDQINELALQGKNPQEIAKQLEQPVGQVELILNLRKRAEQS